MNVNYIGTKNPFGTWYVKESYYSDLWSLVWLFKLTSSRLFYVFLIVELLTKLVVILIIVYLKRTLYSLDFKTLLMHYNYFSSFRLVFLVWDYFLLILLVTFFSFHTIIAFSNDVPLFLSSLSYLTPYPQALALAK